MSPINENLFLVETKKKKNQTNIEDLRKNERHLQFYNDVGVVSI